jgi:hypothetical protein
MSNETKYLKNVPLEVGDQVVAVTIGDPYTNIRGGMKGKVTSVNNFQGVTIYGVKWINGNYLGLTDAKKCPQCNKEFAPKDETCNVCNVPLKPLDQWRKLNKSEETKLDEGFLFETTKKQMIKKLKF